MKKLIFILLLLWFSSCEQEKKNNSVGAFTALYTNVFSQNCLDCHQPGGTEQSQLTLDFSTQALAYDTLVNGLVVGNVGSGVCSNAALVEPGDADNSYLAIIFDDQLSQTGLTNQPGCTIADHVSNNYLSAESAADIVEWINSGATSD